MTGNDLVALLLVAFLVVLAPLAARFGADTRTSRGWDDATDLPRPPLPDAPRRSGRR